MSEVEAVTGAAQAAVASYRAALAGEFGWTQIDVQVVADAQARALRLCGEVLLPGVMAGLGQRMLPMLRLLPMVPAGWRLDMTGVVARPGLGWRALAPGVTPLWRAPRVRPERDGRLSVATCQIGHVAKDMELTSELWASDGAVMLLAELGGWSLVRAGDGTVGWLRGSLVATAGPGLREVARVGPAVALRRLGARLRQHLGVPYRLGGTTRRHIDCSGLVQRCAREALGLVLPRHSTDQLQRAVAPGRALGEPGDLLFMTGVDAASCHVGVVLRGPKPGTRTLVHASSRHGRVVEEPLDGCLARASRVQHMELAQLLELA